MALLFDIQNSHCMILIPKRRETNMVSSIPMAFCPKGMFGLQCEEVQPNRLWHSCRIQGIERVAQGGQSQQNLWGRVLENLDLHKELEKSAKWTCSVVQEEIPQGQVKSHCEEAISYTCLGEVCIPTTQSQETFLNITDI